jgi:2-polyprenyl-3-methyl-5-hydroxy-6-metoxy-1,4-benzoquinol methylase
MEVRAMALSEKEMKHLQGGFKRIENKYYHFRIFERMLERNGIDLRGKVILDAGCGAGYTLELLHEKFKPRELHAFDITPEQVEVAKTRGVPANIFLGNIQDTGFPPGKFDAVFVQGVLHHVEDWRPALREISRIMNRGGALLLQEPNRKFLKFADRYLKIHHDGDGFAWPELEAALQENDLTVLECKSQVLHAGLWRDFLCIKT